MKSIMLVTGGTGGHIFPTLAIGEKLKNMGFKPVVVIRNKPQDIEIVKKYNLPHLPISASGFFGKNLGQILVFFVNFLMSVVYFPLTVLRIKPIAIVVSGGFTSLVPALWALLLNIKFFILEQNRIPGRFTKYFSKWANEIYLGFPLVRPMRGKSIYTGNPLRKEILNTTRQDDGRTVLVLGGSLGARFLNQTAVELVKQMPEINFIIQTGKRDFNVISQMIKADYVRRSGLRPSKADNCQLIDFTTEPEKYYQKATVVITRAGGMVLSEILFFGIPSIIIPFPFATDNHQAANAQFLFQNGAAIILDQNRQPGPSLEFILKLKEILQQLLNDKNKLKRMSDNARKIAKSDATSVICERLLKRL